MVKRNKLNKSIENFEKSIKEANNDRCAFCFEKIDEKLSELRKLFEEEYNKLKEEYEGDIKVYGVVCKNKDLLIDIQEDKIKYYEKTIKSKDKEIEKLNKELEELKKSDKKTVKKNIKKNIKKQSNKTDKKPIYALEHIHELEFEEN